MSVVLKYKAKLIDKGLKEATVNRRLAAVKSLVEMGRKLGVCHPTLGDIKGEKIVGYRDTTGVNRATFERILQQCDRATLAGSRVQRHDCLPSHGTLRVRPDVNLRW